MVRKAVMLAAVVAGTTLLLSATAGAHVTIDPDEAAKGGFATFAFQVPNEESAAGTNQVEVQFPPDHPIAFVSVQPIAGWTATVTKRHLDTPLTSDDGEVTEAVSTVTWTGGPLRPGEFQQYVVSAGPLPDVDSLEFKTIQTYDDGTVVRWIEPTPASGEEPEHPAPTLTLVAGEEGHGHADETATTAAESDEHDEDKEDDDSGETLGYVAIGIGSLALVLALIGIVAQRRRAA